MPDATKVTAGKPKVGGSVHAAPSGTALPTDATTALAATYKDLGYVSEDGVTNENTPESEEVKAWGGDIVLSPTTAKPDRFTCTLIEALNEDVLKTVYGSANVTGSITGNTGLKISANASDTGEYVYVFDMILTGNVLKRIVIPKGKIVEMEEITYNDTDPVGYGITIAGLPDALGNTHYEYLKQPSGA